MVMNEPMVLNPDAARPEAWWRAFARAVTPGTVRRWYWAAHRRRVRRRIERGSHYEPRVGAALRRVIQPGWVCLDVGANRGFLTIAMAKLVGPRGRVHAFEPHRENVRELRRNLFEFNVADRVHIHPIAVHDGSSQFVDLYEGRRRSPSEWNIMGRDADGRATAAEMRVRSASLDDALSPGARVDFVKIDVEGAESLVLAGMARLLARDRPVLLIECHSESNWRACLALRGVGYELTDLSGAMIGERDRRVSHLIARGRAMERLAA